MPISKNHTAGEKCSHRVLYLRWRHRGRLPPLSLFDNSLFPFTPLLPLFYPSFTPLLPLFYPSFTPLLPLFYPSFYHSFITLLSLFYHSFIPLLSLFYPSFIPLLSLFYPSFIPLLSLFNPSLIPLLSPFYHNSNFLHTLVLYTIKFFKSPFLRSSLFAFCKFTFSLL
jgi:hypothetical protein